MNREDCEEFINCLRSEVEAYGALLAQIERQQRGLFRPDPSTIVDMAETVEAAVRHTDEIRTRRERFQTELARQVGMEDFTTLRHLLPHFPEVFVPMLESFSREINRLIHTVRRRSRQNHSLLSRALQIHRDAMDAMRPGENVPTYGESGKIRRYGSYALSAAG